MWPNLQFPADLVTFAEEILNGKLHFLRSEKFEEIFWWNSSNFRALRMLHFSKQDAIWMF